MTKETNVLPGLYFGEDTTIGTSLFLLLHSAFSAKSTFEVMRFEILFCVML